MAKICASNHHLRLRGDATVRRTKYPAVNSESTTIGMVGLRQELNTSTSNKKPPRKLKPAVINSRRLRQTRASCRSLAESDRSADASDNSTTRCQTCSNSR